MDLQPAKHFSPLEKLAASGKTDDGTTAVGRARQLRRTMTNAEQRLWSGLRDRRLGGLKFRRQQPLGPFYADFVCIEAGLIVEADGSQHDDEEQAWYDYHRTKWLERHGFRVLRFDNRTILKHPTAVLNAIAQAARQRGSVWARRPSSPQERRSSFSQREKR